MRPISTDLRSRIIKDADAVLGNAELAKKFSVSLAFVKKLKKQRSETGSIEPLPHRDGRRRALASREDEIRELIDSGKAPTLGILRHQLGVKANLKTIWIELRRLGYRHKKRL